MYTNAVPRSGWSKTINMGIKAIAQETAKRENNSLLRSVSARKRASIIITEIFTNSDGCKLKGPILIQREEL